MRARHRGNGIDLARLHALPQLLGPVRGREHGQQRQQQCERAERQQQPLIDAAAMAAFGREEKPNRGPRHDLIALAEQEVNEQRHRECGDRSPDRQDRTEHGKQRVRHEASIRVRNATHSVWRNATCRATARGKVLRRGYGKCRAGPLGSQAATVRSSHEAAYARGCW